MKPLYTNFFLLFLLFIAFNNLDAQCPPGDVLLRTQADVNQFKIDYPNCTQIDGDLVIGHPDGGNTVSNITDLTPLSNITSITLSLYIQCNGVLKNVHGLESLSNVGGDVFIGGSYGDDISNLALENVDGLSGLQQIGGWIALMYNYKLTNLNGLSNLTAVGADIYLEGNAILSDISGLQNTSFQPDGGYGLTILDNPLLSICNYPNFCAYLANDYISHPRDIAGNAGDCFNESTLLNACKPECPPGDVLLASQADVNQFKIDYPNCTKIEGQLLITGNDIVNLDGINNIQRIEKDIYIQNSDALTGISPLPYLTSIGGYLLITECDNLVDINGLEHITSIGSFINISSNPKLKDIGGIRNIDPETIGGNLGLFIVNNEALYICDYPNICTYIAKDNTVYLRNIKDNAGSCADIIQLKAACNPPCPPGDVSLLNQSQVNQFAIDYPNCTQIDGNLFIGNVGTQSDINDLTPLNKINHIKGWLSIQSTSLTTLLGLENLKDIQHDLEIRNNSGLRDITALNKTTFAPFNGVGLQLVNNPSLAYCNIESICYYLSHSNVSHPRDISGNDTDCSSVSIVESQCIMNDASLDIQYLNIHPNPVHDIITIDYNKVITHVHIYNTMGQQVYSKNIDTSQTNIDVHHLPAGTYILMVNSGDKQTAVRVIKN